VKNSEGDFQSSLIVSRLSVKHIRIWLVLLLFYPHFLSLGLLCQLPWILPGFSRHVDIVFTLGTLSPVFV